MRLPPAGDGSGTRGAFHCFLSEQPGYLVPAHLRGEVPDDDALVLDPGAWCSSWGGEVPAHVAAGQPLPDEFLGGADLIWPRAPTAGAAAPFWLDPATRDELSRLRAGGAPPLELAPPARAALASAGVLVRPDGPGRRAAGDEWAAAARSFRDEGHCAMRGLVHPFHVGALRRHCRRLLRTGGMTLGDRGNPRRFVAHNEGVARFFHRQLTSTVAAVAGVPVKPSYVYVASYQSGAELPLHGDRAQCEYSITLLVDFTPDPDGASPWPLHLLTAGGRVTVWQALGDALLYRGRRLAHYRDRLPEGMTSTSILFHYVDRDFTGPLD